MKKTKHTPGPWKADRMLISPKAKDRRPGFVVNGPDRRNDLPIRICDLRVPAGLDGLAVGEANARLIAAAPDLLEIARDILPEGNDYSDGTHCDECGTPRETPEQNQCDVPGCFYTRIRAAIARAEGNPTQAECAAWEEARNSD